MSDESLREIQLNGKQLVFLFMAATVVLVVTFLFGVLVGRDVQPDGASASRSASAEIAADPAMPPADTATPPVASTTVDGPKPADQLSYPDRLQRDTAPAETLKAAPTVQEPVPTSPPPRPAVREAAAPPPPAPKAAAPAAVSAPPAATTKPPTRDALPTATVDPSGAGFAVQVGIASSRREADVLAKELIGKGYPAFVVDPIKGASKPIFRIRIGKYKNRKDAEAVSARLERVEKYTPWIAR